MKRAQDILALVPSLLICFLILFGSGTTTADDDGPAKRAWHGLSLNIDGRKEADAGGPYYVFYDPPEVWNVEDKGPAHRAGIRRGDRLLRVNGHLFTSDAGGRIFPNLAAGDTVEIVFERDGVELTTSWVADSRESSPSADLDPDRAEHLRYAGNHWGRDFEVRGDNPVVVTVNRDRQEVLIIGDSMIVRVRASDGQD